MVGGFRRNPVERPATPSDGGKADHLVPTNRPVTDSLPLLNKAIEMPEYVKLTKDAPDPVTAFCSLPSRPRSSRVQGCPAGDVTDNVLEMDLSEIGPIADFPRWMEEVAGIVFLVPTG